MTLGARTRVLMVALLAAALPAFAQTELPAAAEVPTNSPSATEPPTEEAAVAFSHKVEANGYASSRTGYGRSRFSGLYSTADIPQWQELIELNAQLKVSYHQNGFAYADVSLIPLFGVDFRGIDQYGVETMQVFKDSPANRPLISVNELYLLQEFTPWLNLMIGKKRLVWGSGQAFNPTDLLNVRKDPTDPTFQRAGAWLARLEVPLETSAFTLLFAPQVTESAFGVPYGFVVYPEWDTRRPDSEAHFLVAARAYFLVANTDLNVMAYFSNKYHDDFANKVRVGASASRIFFDTWEVHFEALLQQGSGRPYVTPECVADVQGAIGCSARMQPFVARSKLDDPAWYPTTLVGFRKQFDDDSFLSVEYLFQADGYRPDQYQDLINAIDGVNAARMLGVPLPAGAGLLLPTSSAQDNATPSRFNFVPVVKHYAFITFQKPRIRDDFTAQLVLLANLQDLSTLWTPSIVWSTTEWLQLSLVGFIPVPGPNALAAQVPTSGRYITEYGAFPQLFRVFFEVRVFY